MLRTGNSRPQEKRDPLRLHVCLENSLLFFIFYMIFTVMNLFFIYMIYLPIYYKGNKRYSFMISKGGVNHETRNG